MPSARRGAALLLAIWGLVLPLLLAGQVGLLQAMTEMRAVRLSAYQAQAFYLAEGRLDQLLAALGADSQAACPEAPAAFGQLGMTTCEILPDPSGALKLRAGAETPADQPRSAQTVEGYVRLAFQPFDSAIRGTSDVTLHSVQGSELLIDSYRSDLGPYGAPIAYDPAYGTLNQSQPDRPASLQGDVTTGSATEPGEIVFRDIPWGRRGQGSHSGTTHVFGDLVAGAAAVPPDAAVYGCPAGRGADCVEPYRGAEGIRTPQSFGTYDLHGGEVLPGPADAPAMLPQADVPPHAPCQGPACLAAPCAGSISVPSFNLSYSTIDTEAAGAGRACDLALVGNGTIHVSRLWLGRGSSLTLDGRIDIVVDDASVGPAAIDRWATPVWLGTEARVRLEPGSAGSMFVLDGGAVSFGPASRIAADSGERALPFQLYVNGDVSVYLQRGAQFVGSIYAPKATVDLSSGAEVFGSIVSQHVTTLGAGVAVHFDEALRPYEVRLTGAEALRLLLWHQPD
jgi:hypothetical protein